MAHFFGLSKSSNTPSSPDSSSNSDPNKSFIQPDDDDIWSQREIDSQRTKWKAFLKSRGNIWSEKWLWQNWKFYSQVRSNFLIQRKLSKIFDTKIKMRKKLKKLIRKGVPPELRGQVWWACSGAEDKRAAASSDQQFAVMVQRSSQLDHSVAHDIEKDLKRTFPDLMKENTKYYINDSLRKVLLAYAVRNTAIGYCQSMNYICALLLFHLEEERAFWVLAALIEDILPKNYYNSTLIGGRIDQQVFQSCIAGKLSKIHAVFKATDTILEPILVPWFLCLYINVLPLYTVCRVWDCLFWEGNTILFRIGLTMMNSKSKQLLQAYDFLTVYSILKRTLPGKSHSFQLESAHHSNTNTNTNGEDAGEYPSTVTSDTTSTTTTTTNITATVGGGTSVSMSDTEGLLHSAFGYKWIKFVPVQQIEALREKFGQLMDSEYVKAEPASASPKKLGYRLRGLFSPSQSQSIDDNDIGGGGRNAKSPSGPSGTASGKSSPVPPTVSAEKGSTLSAGGEAADAATPGPSSSKRRNMSVLIQSALYETDANTLRQLALQMDEGLGSEVEKFAKEMDDGASSSSNSTSCQHTTSADSVGSIDKHDDDEDDDEDDDDEDNEGEESGHGYDDEASHATGVVPAGGTNVTQGKG